MPRTATTSDNPDGPLTMTAADLLTRSYSYAEHRRGCEASYRRSCQQSLGFAYDLVERSGSVREALHILGRAEAIAGELRRTRRDQGNGMLLDYIRARLHKRGSTA
jgi:hypothetical protein